jgi:XTP/dITP diphosphohydrolase
MELVLATRNLHKVREFREMIKSLRFIDVLSLHDFPQYQLPNIQRDCFEEGAKEKALHAAQALQRYVLADDSGLVIPALGGAPGAASKAYAGEEATDRENCQKVLREMKDKVDLERAAFLTCTLAFADASGIKKTVTGICEGEVIEEERGRFGYGYDTIFRKHDYEKTFSELEENIRIRISHRRKAFDKLALYLESLCR